MTNYGFYTSDDAYSREQARHMERWKKKEAKRMEREKEIEKLKKAAMLGISTNNSEAASGQDQ